MELMDVLPEVVIGFGGGFTGWFFSRKKQELDNVDKATAIWRKLAEDLKNDLTELRENQETILKENAGLKLEVGELKVTNQSLTSEVKKLETKVQTLTRENKKLSEYLKNND